MFGVLFWIFLVAGLVIAVLGFIAIYKPQDDRNGNGKNRLE